MQSLNKQVAMSSCPESKAYRIYYYYLLKLLKNNSNMPAGKGKHTLIPVE